RIGLAPWTWPSASLRRVHCSGGPPMELWLRRSRGAGRWSCAVFGIIAAGLLPARAGAETARVRFLSSGAPLLFCRLICVHDSVAIVDRNDGGPADTLQLRNIATIDVYEGMSVKPTRIVGGVLGGAMVGGILGTVIGAIGESNCHGEFCGV